MPRRRPYNEHTQTPMPTLILSLPLPTGNATPEYDYVLSPDGQQEGAHGRAAAALLPQAGARSTEVVAVIPGRALSWHHIAVPERVLRSLLGGRSEPSRLRGVLAGVLEEQLLDEPERLHFAVFADTATATGEARGAWVAACERAWLHTSLQALEASGHTVSRLVAEGTPMAGGMARALLSADMEPAQLLLCSAQGVSLLPLLPASQSLAQAHADLEVLAEPAVMELAQSRFGNQVTLQTRSQRLLAAAQSPWNLAQLELSASPGGRLQKRLATGWQQLLHAPAWRPVRWGVLALALVQLVALNALAWQQRSHQAALRAAIADTLQQSFPDIRLVINPPLQMQRAVDDLARARGAGTDTDLGRVFSILGPLTPQSLHLSAIDLADQQLRLRSAELDTAQAQPLVASLQARGLNAQWQDGQLQVRPKESR